MLACRPLPEGRTRALTAFQFNVNNKYGTQRDNKDDPVEDVISPWGKGVEFFSNIFYQGHSLGCDLRRLFSDIHLLTLIISLFSPGGVLKHIRYQHKFRRQWHYTHSSFDVGELRRHGLSFIRIADDWKWSRRNSHPSPTTYKNKECQVSFFPFPRRPTRQCPWWCFSIKCTVNCESEQAHNRHS